MSQKSKVDEWIRSNAEDTGLDLEDITDDIGNMGKKQSKKISPDDAKEQESIAKKALSRLRAELKELLGESIKNHSHQFSKNNKPKFVVFAK